MNEVPSIVFPGEFYKAPYALSVIISYYNRPQYLENTLWSIHHMTARVEPFEVIIVDDTSIDEQRAERVADRFKELLDIKVIYRPEKKGRNRGVPINIGVKAAQGDIVLIQDTDNMHMTSVINQLLGMYLYGARFAAFCACYNVTKADQTMIERKDLSVPTSVIEVRDEVELLEKDSENEEAGGWYCHSFFRPMGNGAPFAMWREDFLTMGGFDEDFAEFWGFEDSDLINRIHLMGMPQIVLDDVLTFHQQHYDIGNREDMMNRMNGWEHNKRIWDGAKEKRTDWVANAGREWGVL